MKTYWLFKSCWVPVPSPSLSSSLSLPSALLIVNHSLALRSHACTNSCCYTLYTIHPRLCLLPHHTPPQGFLLTKSSACSFWAARWSSLSKTMQQQQHQQQQKTFFFCSLLHNFHSFLSFVEFPSSYASLFCSSHSLFCGSFALF